MTTPGSTELRQEQGRYSAEAGRFELWFLTIGLAGLASALLFDWIGPIGWSRVILISVTSMMLLVLARNIVRALLQRRIGLDLLAAMSMTAALTFHEYFAAAIVALMYASGQYLEARAQMRAESGMAQLLSRAPRSATKVTDAGLTEVPISTIQSGDRVVVRRGEVVPVDGHLTRSTAVLNESALTGEAMAVCYPVGSAVRSGGTNEGDMFELVTDLPAASSTYAGIVRLVETARDSKAPMSRLADRYSVAFLVAASATSVLAAALSGDMVRLVAVLVVATPCPLILAVPVALIAGVSRAAAHGILIKGSSVLETAATVEGVIFDKTGTLTTGAPRLTSVDAPDASTLLMLAASLEQASTHSIAKAVVKEAQDRGLTLQQPSSVNDFPGDGIEGVIGVHKVAVGGADFIRTRTSTIPVDQGGDLDKVMAQVAVDGEWKGTLVFADEVKAEAKEAISALREIGIPYVAVATGDRRHIAANIAGELGIGNVYSELSPKEKVDIIASQSRPTMMVGDGVNDAPALARAAVGVALATSNVTAAAEAADVIILRDDLRLIPDAIAIARRARSIALQSASLGMGLSMLAMLAAAFGYLLPVEGALVQEAIDVAVVVNALRAR